MVALMSKSKEGQLIPMDVAPQISLLLLKAQYLEAIEMPFYFQMGINMDYIIAEDPNGV